MQRGQAITRKLKRPRCSQFADAKKPALKPQGIQYLSDQLRFG
jgi:hypothetical protein